ncbi:MULTISPECIES: helix-turn-helix transcriptional regulator [Roseobacter]|uniref:DNA binding helix-turn helix-like protein n=3 Tax=Roseobacter litoralis TaxID=42443 RepID=F7ZGU2_ROSLO|nr:MULTISPECIES: helix-turn-helix transcriptional regulator [Roseobacter]AEI93593.1 DNA binding helix-turn helix-like protein [Roseobacter litoralis Och 149]GIT85569.1 XRE family transcriptional regulator [Roseobacter sp. OBYS 0001]
MPREGLIGSRIRERRSVAGLKQADLARSLGISPSYLNLIEHNRRRIGGKLLLDIARVLSVEPSLLTEGAEAALIATLREAAKSANLSSAEVERADELTGRFPGWAEVLASGHRRITTLERTVEVLSDRLTHDPKLAASVHELLSTAAAIRSTASILAEEKDIEAEWRDRFHSNLNEDSKRLADSSKALVNYFEAGQDDASVANSPQEEVDAFLAAHDYYFKGLEAGEHSVDDVIAQANNLRSPTARALARGMLNRMQADAAKVPMAALDAALQKVGLEPIALAARLDAPVGLVLRRIAASAAFETGLVVCDRAGSILLRKSVGQMVMPRFGSACALWPLFSALCQPGQVIRTPLVQLGRGRAHFDCFAVAEVVGETQYNAPPLIEANMLLIANSAPAQDTALEVGSTCGVCPKSECPGRREPSILMAGI